MYGTTEATDKLFAAMQRGELKAKDLLPKLSKEFAAFSEAGLPSATKSIGAEIERFTNSIFGFFTTIGEAGALDGVTAVIRILGDVIRGLTPIMAKLIGAFSGLARVLLVPLEALAKALQLITKIDSGIGFLIGRIGELVGASKGITEFAQNMLSLSTLLAFSTVAPILGKMTVMLGKFFMLFPMAKRMSKHLKGTFGVMKKGHPIVNKLSKAFLFLRTSVGLANVTLMGFLGRIILPFLAVAAVVEDLTAVLDPNKDSITKWAMTSESAIAEFVRGPLGLLVAGILMLDQLFASFFGADLKTDRLREQVEDIFKIKIDAEASSKDIWKTFWRHLRKGPGEEGDMDLKLGLEPKKGAFDLFFRTVAPQVHQVSELLSKTFEAFTTGTLVESITKPFKDAWDWIYKLFANDIPSALGSLGSRMIGVLKNKFFNPLKKLWNSVADKAGLDKFMIGEKGSKSAAGRSKGNVVDLSKSKGLENKPIPIPKKEAGLDKQLNALNKIGNPMNNVTVNMTQTVNAAPGMSAEQVGNTAFSQAKFGLQQELTRTLANAPRTE